MRETPEELHRIEILIGRLLRWGVTLAATVISIGGVLFLASDGSKRAAYGRFRPEDPHLNTFSGVVHGVARLDGAAIIQAGLLLLVATPIARVIFSLGAFLYERDWLYSVFTTIVLAVLAYGILG